MKHYLMGAIALFFSLILLSGCKEEQKEDVMKVGIAAEYPPFAFMDYAEIKGLEVDLAHLIGQELSKKVELKNITFRTIFPALDADMIDVGISGISVTAEREKQYDFSVPYHYDKIAVVFPLDKPINEIEQLSGKKVGCQLGSTLEIWMAEYAPQAQVVTSDANDVIIEALKAGKMDAVILAGAQAKAYSEQYPGVLGYALIAQDSNGCAAAFKKGSPLKDQVNVALKALEAKGELLKLQEKWLQGKQ